MGMEKLFRKLENGRYQSVGYSMPEMYDGIWVVESNGSGKSVTNLAWKVGDIKRPVDVTTHVAIQSMEDVLIDELFHIQRNGIDGVCDHVSIGNVSMSELATHILRALACEIEKQENEKG